VNPTAILFLVLFNLCAHPREVQEDMYHPPNEAKLLGQAFPCSMGIYELVSTTIKRNLNSQHQSAGQFDGS